MADEALQFWQGRGNIKSFQKQVVDKSNWSKEIGKWGKMKYVLVKDIREDSDYQRHPRPHHVSQIAADFDCSAFGAPILSQRTDGSLVALDGGNRIAAAFLRGIEKIPALVFEGLSKQREAQLFEYFNAKRISVRPLEVFRSRLISKQPTAIFVQKCVEQICHSEITFSKRNGQGIACVSKLSALTDKYGQGFMEDVFLLTSSAWKSEEDVHHRYKEYTFDAVSRFLAYAKKIEEYDLDVSLRFLSKRKLNLDFGKAVSMQGITKGSLGYHLFKLWKEQKWKE